MKGRTNKPKGRKPKGKETRKAVSFRLQPETAAFIKQWAADLGCSQSDLIEDWIAGINGTQSPLG